MDLSETVDRKFVESFDIDDYEILTDDGWHDCKAIHKTVEYNVWNLKTTTFQLKCADTHIVFNEYMQQVFVKDLKVGQKIHTENGLEEVLDVQQTADNDNMYDIELNDDSNHRYYTDGILSHNTTTYTVFCLWLATLFPDKRILICANKLATAIEVMDRIRKAYEQLPFWIKPGCLSYNKGGIVFANGSSIRAFSTSSSGARGASGNCVAGDTLLTMKDDIGNTFYCKISDVEDLLKTKKLKVLAVTGWKKFLGVRITETFDVYVISFSNGTQLRCTPEHLIKLENLQFAKACELKVNDVVYSKLHNKKLYVTDIANIKLNVPEKMYDLTNVEDEHEYQTNSVISHNCLIIDEMAFIPENIMNEFFASVMPIVSSSKKSKVIIVSTPNGASGMYYDIWQRANSNESKVNKEGWKPFRINWWETGGIRDEEWKQQQIASVGLDTWKQEYECDFLTSSTKKLIPDDILDKYKQKQSELKLQGKTKGKRMKILSQQEDKIFEWTMWHEFDPKHTYLASGDIAEGVGGDSSILYVWDVTDLSNIMQCAKFESNSVSVVEFAFVINKILALYNNPYFIAERNGVSGGTLDSLRITYQYPRIVCEGKDGEPGVYSHVTVKGKACLWAREMLTTLGFGFTFYDTDILDEFQYFVKKDTKGVHLVYQALPPSHDDYVMSFIWLCYVLQNHIVEKYFNVKDTFTSATNVQYAKILFPLQEYTLHEINSVTSDPMYKEFLEFKQEVMNSLGKALQDEQRNKNDIFQFPQDGRDIYFGGCDTMPSWNSNDMMPRQSNINLSPYNRMPSFYINGGGGFY